MKPKTYSDFYHLHDDLNEAPQLCEWELFYLRVPSITTTYTFDCKGILLFEVPYEIMDNHTRSDLLELKRELVCNTFTNWYEPGCKWGIINEKGELIVEMMYGGFGEEWLAGQYISATKNGKLGFIDRDGKVIIDFQFDFDNIDCEWMDHPNFDCVEIKISETEHPAGAYDFTSKIGVVDFECNYIIPAEFKSIHIEEAEYRGWRIEELTPEELTDYKAATQIFLEDFEGNHFLWTYHNGMTAIDKPFEGQNY